MAHSDILKIKNIGFSVLLSVYKNDYPEFFEQSLSSISKNQTLKPTQIVIVKDGPVNVAIDSILERYRKICSDIEFTIVVLEKNCGLAVALNHGLKACKFELVARMDADDIAVSQRFEKQIAYMMEHPEIVVLGGAIAEFDHDPQKTTGKRKGPSFNEQIVKQMQKRNPMNHMTVVFKKSAVTISGGYTETIGKLEDYKLWVDLALNKALFHNLSEVLVAVRTGNGFFNRRSDTREIKDWDQLQAYMKAHGFIGFRQQVINRIAIRGFIYLPGGIKKQVYKLFLRK